MGLDPSALSRAFDGRRQVKSGEAAQIARLLGVSGDEVNYRLNMRAVEGSATRRASARDGHPGAGFMEAQLDFEDTSNVNNEDEERIIPPRGADPLFGCMAGTLTLLPDVDYTGPADPDWGRAYEN